MQYLAVYDRTKRNAFLAVCERDTRNTVSRMYKKQSISPLNRGIQEIKYLAVCEESVR